MQISVSKLVALGVLGIASITAVHAQDAGKGLKAYFLTQLADTEKKFVGLADAMPAEKYSWRPADGVRSVSEVFVHVSGANYMLGNRFIGTKIPESVKMSRTMEKDMTDKAKIIDFMKGSFAYLRDAASGMSDADLQKSVKLFGGQETNGAGALMFLADHMHEHLGQSIAYARSNGVVPPWSQGQ